MPSGHSHHDACRMRREIAIFTVLVSIFPLAKSNMSDVQIVAARLAYALSCAEQDAQAPIDERVNSRPPPMEPHQLTHMTRFHRHIKCESLRR